jgi:hypothetical protein
MRKEKVKKWKTRLQASGWHLATHSTLLDRRLSQHMLIGPLRFQRPVKHTFQRKEG